MAKGTDWETILVTLASEYRRRALVALLERGPQGEDVGVPEDVHVGDEELEVLRIELYHVHLPRLREAGFIRWDSSAHEIRPGPRFEEIRPLLELIEDHRDELPDGWT